MPDRICSVDFQPIGARAACTPGTDLLAIARQAGISISSVCGGRGTCGRCRVQIMEGEVTPLTSTERRVLGKDAERGIRLACQVKVLGSVKVHVPASSLTAKQRTQVESQAVSFALEPVIGTVAFSLEAPTLTDLRADTQRLEDVAGRALTWDNGVLHTLSDDLRARQWCGSLATRDDEVVALLPKGQAPLGLAVDLGTTKVAAYLCDLHSGATLAADAIMNPQISYGEDVMARMTFALEGEEKAEQLCQAIRTGIDDLLGELCAEAGVERAWVSEAVVVGNTAMHHVFLGLPLGQLGNAPYLAAVNSSIDVKARDVGLNLAPGAYVHLLPNIAGFVGADHVSSILATGLDREMQTAILLDVGTNTEIALAHQGRLTTCSTASGPAFEGAHVSCGMRAADGAVERVRVDDEGVRFQTIGDAKAVGICGSGILDVVAQLYRQGILDMKGGMQDGYPGVRSTETGREYVIVPEAESGTDHDIVVTRADVGEIQLAKAAMRAGVNVLLNEAGIKATDLQRFVVAGAFGTYIDVESAMDVAMFPVLPVERFEQVGNAAGAGARMALLSRSAREKARAIAKEAGYIELTNYMRFTEQFTLAMFLSQDMMD